jgi:hypothetical protein
MMKTEQTAGVASKNGVNQYVLFLPEHNRYLQTWTQHGWDYSLCDTVDQACSFPTVTAALLVGFCMGFGDDMRATDRRAAAVRGHTESSS